MSQNNASFLQSIYTRAGPGIIMGGVLPFGCIFIQLFFILNSIWYVLGLMAITLHTDASIPFQSPVKPASMHTDMFFFFNVASDTPRGGGGSFNLFGLEKKANSLFYIFSQALLT